MIQPPTAYQGGKQRIADQILWIINPQGDFYDLCCGCGAVSIALLNRGHNTNQIHMLDKGPWGLVWKMVGEGTFDIARFRTLIEDIPKDRSKIKSYAEGLSKQPADIDTPYVYLILQAASFGSKAIWIKDNRWQNTSFRNYWLPTETSNRRSPVNPMMPMPETLLERMYLICEKMYGIHGYYCDINDIEPLQGDVYIDPPYAGTTFYGHSFDVKEYVKGLKPKCYVSEGVVLSNDYVRISSGRAKGGISGERKRTANQEFLSIFN